MIAPLFNEQDHSTKLVNQATLQLGIQKTTTDDDTLTPYYLPRTLQEHQSINQPHPNYTSGQITQKES